jgi:hypothetical protein
MRCARCGADKAPTQFYAGDRTCKVCRCALVRANRAASLLEALEKAGVVSPMSSNGLRNIID